MMEEYWGGGSYTPPAPPAGTTPKGQNQSAPAPATAPKDEDVGSALRSAVTITAPTPVFKKR